MRAMAVLSQGHSGVLDDAFMALILAQDLPCAKYGRIQHRPSFAQEFLDTIDGRRSCVPAPERLSSKLFLHPNQEVRHVQTNFAGL